MTLAQMRIGLLAVETRLLESPTWDDNNAIMHDHTWQLASGEASVPYQTLFALTVR